MSAAYDTIESSNSDLRAFTLVQRSNGNPITVGTANWYLLALTGANAGKWWQTSDGTWQAAETANAMVHRADGHWTIDPIFDALSPWDNGIEFLEYAKESGDLHVPVSRKIKAGFTPAADANQRVALADLIADAANKIADHVHRRHYSAVEQSPNGDSLDKDSGYGAGRQIQRSNTTQHPGELTIFLTDGTELGRRTLSTDAAGQPMVGIS